MELRRRTWLAAVRLAIVASVLAVAIAIAASSRGGIPDTAIVVPVIVAAFVASWIQTGRVRSTRVRVGIAPRRPHLHVRPVRAASTVATMP